MPLGQDACLIGVDGWGDGRLGDPAGTGVLLNDFVRIEELCGLGREALLERLQALGDESAILAGRLLDEALSRFRRVLFVTHVPPFREACWHEGQISDDDWLPWFTCQAVGDVLSARLGLAADRSATVLCGHTHGAGVADVLPNLRVHTGGAEYGAPRIAALLDVAPDGIRVAPWP